jgi:thioredoxin 1
MAYRLAISGLQIRKMNTKITVREFDQEVLKAGLLSIVQFRTEWNGACEIIAPIYEDLASSYKNVANFFTIDADKEKKVSSQFCINETPTILFFKNGNVIDYAIGLISKNILISKIETALSQNNN